MLKEIAEITEEYGIEVRVRLGEVVLVVKNGNVSFNGVGCANAGGWIESIMNNEGGVLNHLRDKALRKANCTVYDGDCSYCEGC